MAMMIEQRAQLLQTLGSIATSAADSAAEGIAEATKADSKTIDTALKLFGGFDRSEFENINRQAPSLLTPAVRPPGSYEGPVEYFKLLSNVAEQGFLVRSKDLLQQLEDPRFRMADGLSGFSDHRITQAMLQNRIVINSGPVTQESNGLPQPDITAALDDFGKLYTMENTVAKQLQLHDQLNFGAMGRFLGSRQAAPPNAESPKLNQPLKERPDLSTTPAHQEMVNLLEHALTGTPQTTGELLMMVDALQARIEQELNSIPPDAINHDLAKNFCNKLLGALSTLENSAKNQNANMAPDFDSLQQLRAIQWCWHNAKYFTVF
jgi:hypothetical protein